jgi:dTDP-4-dehydrorhamnose 3,5-epimerase
MPEFVPGTLSLRDCQLEGLKIGKPVIRPDVRGWFVRIYDDASWPMPTGFGSGRWVQENQLRSRHTAIRGLHFRADLTEAKLLRVVRGEIFDVVLDLRPWSTTFGQWESFILDDRRHEQLFVPPGCAHGFQALTDVDLCIKTSTPYDPSLDRGVSFSDQSLKIPWPIPNPVVSRRDLAAPAFEDVSNRLPEWFGSARPDQ